MVIVFCYFWLFQSPIKGEKGEQGSSGEMGIAGAKGDKGEAGNQGQKGVEGAEVMFAVLLSSSNILCSS